MGFIYYINDESFIVFSQLQAHRAEFLVQTENDSVTGLLGLHLRDSFPQADLSVARALVIPLVIIGVELLLGSCI